MKFLYRGHRTFRFVNGVVDEPNFLPSVQESWNRPVEGRGMYVVWKKLKMVQPVIQRLKRKFSGIREQVLQAREELHSAQSELVGDRMNVELVEKVQTCTVALLHWHDMEEKLLQQRFKIDWIRLGDGNTSYFPASVKTKNRNIGIKCLQKSDGCIVTSQTELESEVLAFYTDLVGTST